MGLILRNNFEDKANFSRRQPSVCTVVYSGGVHTDGQCLFQLAVHSSPVCTYSVQADCLYLAVGCWCC